MYVFGHYAYSIVHDLEKSTANHESTHRLGAPHRERALPQKCHERCVIRQDTDLAVEGGRYDRVRFTVEHSRFGGNHRDMHHELASFLAFSTASSMPPTIQNACSGR